MRSTTIRRLPLIVCDRTIERHRRLQLVAADAVVQAAAGTPTDRTLRGLVLPYAADGRTSAGRVRASAGRVRWSPELRRIKVFVGHDRTRPVGYVTALAETTAGLTAELHIAATPDGDSALLEAREGTRDALSVELEDVELDDDGELVAAELAAVALVPLPAFSDARIAAELGDDDDQDDDDQAPPAPPTPPAPAGRRAPVRLTATRRRTGTMTMEAAVTAAISSYQRSDRSAASLTAALANITPVSTNWAAAAPYQWIDEIWRPVLNRLNWVQAAGSGVLTNMTITGFKFVEPGPTIKPYAGNKAPIPTDGTLGFAPITVPAQRHAVGADFDRIWLDLGDESVINTWISLVAQSYAKVLDDLIGASVLGDMTAAGYAPDVMAAIDLACQALDDVGAAVSWVAVAPDLWSAYRATTSADAPWWLASSSSVNQQDSSFGGQRIFRSPVVPAGTVIAGDKRAVTQYTPRGNPFQVRALDIANGGLDVGVFGYSAELVNDSRGLQSVTVGTDPGAGARTAPRKGGV